MRLNPRWLAVAVVGVLCLVLMACGPQVVRQRLHRYYSVEQFMSTLKVWGSCFSPDERQILITSNATGVFNAFAYPISGGAPMQLTHSTTSNVRTLSYFPANNNVLLTSDVDGNERFHLLVRQENGRVLDITPDTGARANFLHWRHDNSGFYFTWNRRDRRAEDLYFCDAKTLLSTQVWANEQAYEVMKVSHNGRYILVLKSNTAEDADAYYVDLQQGPALKPLLTSEEQVNYTPLSFSLDDASVYVLTNEKREFMYLQQLDLATGQRKTIYEDDWDVMYGFHSRNHRYRVVFVNRNAQVQVHVTDLRTNTEIELPRLPDGDITKVDISPSERYMSFYVNSPTSPNNLYVYDFELKTYRQLTRTLNPDIRPEDLVKAEVVSYKSFDSLSIPAILYRPHNVTAGQLPPAVILVHGGPGAQSRLYYSPLIQFLANHGYAVLDVNYRGSIGFGLSFYKADNRRHGVDDLKDIIWAKRYLGQAGLADTSRIAVLGGSYGGYLVLSALVGYPNTFAAGIDMFGISNLVESLKNMPPWWEHVRNAYYIEMGDPVKDEAFLRAKSPYYFAEQIKRPLLVFQGGNDPRVQRSLTDAMVARIRQAGGSVEYHVFADEGHGFVKRTNEVQGYGTVLRFLDQHLKGGAQDYPLAVNDTAAASPLQAQGLPR